MHSRLAVPSINLTAPESVESLGLEPVVIVCSNVSANCLGRALLLAELVPDSIDARVVGVQLADEIWSPATGFRRGVKGFRVRGVWDYASAGRWLQQELAGARVVVSKPLSLSLGLTLKAGVPPEGLLLDVDDWELGLHAGGRGLRSLVDLLNPIRENSYFAVARMDRKIGGCPRRLVSNGWLQERYGGHLLPHVRDTNRIAPAQSDGAATRRDLGMSAHFWVGFVGTLRSHKGSLELIEAVARAGDDVALFLAGVNVNDAFVGKVIEHAKATLGESRLCVVPLFSFDELPKWLAVPDLICIPSRHGPAAVGQIPAKLFDAMAMGKPIIAADVNDAANVLNGAGEIVPCDDIEALGNAIRRLRDDEPRRRMLGQAARERATAYFSYDAGRRTLMQALQSIRPFHREARG